MRSALGICIAFVVFSAVTSTVSAVNPGDAEIDWMLGSFSDDLTLQRPSSTQVNNDLLADELRCGPSQLVRLQHGFIFMDDEDENGCGSARLPFEVTTGTATIDVRFDIEVRAGTMLPADEGALLIETRLWYGSYRGELSTSAETTGPDEHWVVPTGDAMGGPTTFAFRAASPPGGQVVLEWWFRDVGTTAPDGQTRVTGGQAFEVTVMDPVVGLMAVPAVVTEPVAVSTQVVGGFHETLWRASVEVPARPERPPANVTAMRLEGFEDLDFGGIVGPGGAQPSYEPLEGGRILVSDGPGNLSSGTYTVEFHETAPVALQPVGLIWSVPLLLVAAGLAGRNLVVRAPPSSAGHGIDQARRRVALGLAAATLTLVAAVILFGQMRYLATWPVPWRGISYGLVLLVLTGAMLYEDHRRRHRELVGLEDARRNSDLAADELRTFLHGVTHDMKTPLVALRWLTADLNDEVLEAQEDAQARETLQRIERNIGGLESLVEDLLLLAELESVSTGDEVARVGSVVADVLDGLQEHAARKRVKIRVDGDDSTSVRMDARHLRIVVHNLVVNALKYGRQTDGKVRIRWGHEDGGVVLSVHDDGPGIPVEERTSVLAMFRRGTTAGQAGEAGSGMGLAIVDKIVDHSGGSLTIGDSDLGGARFDVRMPAAN